MPPVPIGQAGIEWELVIVQSAISRRREITSAGNTSQKSRYSAFRLTPPFVSPPPCKGGAANCLRT